MNKGNWILVIVFSTLVLGMLFWMGYSIKRSNVERQYSGPIIEMHVNPPTSGYKSHNDEEHVIVFQDIESGKKIRVEVTAPTYYNAKVGQTITFILSRYDLSNYGNGKDHFK